MSESDTSESFPVTVQVSAPLASLDNSSIFNLSTPETPKLGTEKHEKRSSNKFPPSEPVVSSTLKDNVESPAILPITPFDYETSSFTEVKAARSPSDSSVSFVSPVGDGSQSVLYQVEAGSAGYSYLDTSSKTSDILANENAAPEGISSSLKHLLSSEDTSEVYFPPKTEVSSASLGPKSSTESFCTVSISTGSIDQQTKTSTDKDKPEAKSATTEGKPAVVTSASNDRKPSVVRSESSCCRICQEGRSEEQLISPCYCSGTMGKVHLSCMETWLQVMHRSSCELCQYEFPVERIPQPTYKFFLNPGSSTEFANLMCDITCFIILTPLLIITMFLCTRGVRYYDAHGKTGSMFAVVTLIGSLLVVYVSWAVLAFLYHYRIWRAWRDNTAVIRMAIYKHPKVEKKKSVKSEKPEKKRFKCLKSRRVRGDDESTQTDSSGPNLSHLVTTSGTTGCSCGRMTSSGPGSNFTSFQKDYVFMSRPMETSKSGSKNTRLTNHGTKPYVEFKGFLERQAEKEKAKRRALALLANGFEQSRSAAARVQQDCCEVVDETSVNPGLPLAKKKPEGKLSQDSKPKTESSKSMRDAGESSIKKIVLPQKKRENYEFANDQTEVSLGKTVSFQIEPSNPTTLLSFRYLQY